MNKERLIYIAALALLFLGVFCVYNFYFAAKLERYAQHKELLESLRSSDSKLKAAFGPADPDDVIREHDGKEQVWKEAILARVPFFSDDEWRAHEKPPEDVFILQFWYGDESRKVVEALWEKAQRKYGAQVYQRMPEGFPGSVQAMLGVAYSEAWQGRNITAEMVNVQLEQLHFGVSAIEFLMDNKALQISRVSVEDIGGAGFIAKDVNYTRLGLSFMMEMKDLVGFLEKMRLEDSYFSVQGMRISHPYILARYEPQLQVDMYLIRTKAAEGFSVDGGGSGGGGAASTAEAFGSSFGTTSLRGGARLGGGAAGRREELAGAATREKKTGAAKAWKWFKRNVLFTNK
ncbi:MAG: hypothetical protein L3K26_15475 [Candidatus Hydrogenedentes bacterium]|nr:hypothetical protein [Candidatus Hydrogenedentota bacterium]